MKISLIPKIDSPIKMKDFPISCCDVCYKIISKITVNRLKPILPLLVDDNQSAFVRGRSIQDNILLMHDLVKAYQKIGGPSGCAIKMDIMKAFDTVKWDYLLTILTQMNIPKKVRQWIFLCVCVSTVSFSINLNGSLTDNFNVSRGLRQGNPLFQTLFILVMKVSTKFSKLKPSFSHFDTILDVTASSSASLPLQMIFSSCLVQTMLPLKPLKISWTPLKTYLA